MKLQNIKRKILIPISIALVTLLVAFIIDSYNSSQENYAIELNEKIMSIPNSFNKALEDEAMTMKAVLYTLEKIAPLKKALREKDRDAMLTLTGPLFQQLLDEQSITHFYFTGVNRVNLLRVHKPEKSGDLIDRHSQLEAERTGAIAHGIELGALGTLTLRVVMPVYDNRLLIGYMELGKEIDHVITDISNASGIEIIATVKKELLNQEDWEKGMKMLGHNYDWNHFPESVTIGQTIEAIPSEIESYLSGSHGKDEQIIEVNTKDGKYYKAVVLPLEDSKGTAVGDLIIMENLTLHYALTRKSIVNNIIFSIFVGTLLFVIIYVFISRIEAELVSNYKEMRSLHRELKDRNKDIEENRNTLETALNKVSALIDRVIRTRDHSITLDNPTIKNCYTLMDCSNETCPCFGKEGVRCWAVAGTFCGGDVQGTFAQKYSNCSQCIVYKDATTNPVLHIGEQFNNMMHIFKVKNEALEEALMELKSTQAQMLQREKMASIGQLAAGVAHEINNPMGFISSNLGTMRNYIGKFLEYINAQTEVISSLKEKEAVEKLQEKRKKLKLDFIVNDVQDLVEESLDGAGRVKNIVQNLKSFSRVDEADVKPVDINECIENTLNIVWNEIKYSATVDKDYGNLPLTKCNPQQLNQVFINLLVNAAHAIGKQGEIKIKTMSSDDSINIQISDTGHGIPEDKISKIFEPFFTTKEVGKGTGLGLSISYDIVKKHNGEIAVESTVGKGTTFTVTVPQVT